MGLLATRPGWLRWAGNTLNLGMIRVTCPHLLGPAHNCDDLFPLSKPKGMPPAAPLHLVSLSFSPFSPSDIRSLCFCLLAAISSFCFDKYKMQEYVCVSPNVCLMSTCISVCVLVNSPVCLHAALWPRQPINTTVCLTIRCSMPPAMAPRPKDLHRPLEEDLSCTGAESIVLQWQAAWTVPWGTLPGATGKSRLLRLHNEPVCHTLPPPGSPATPQPRTPHPLMLLTFPVCCWDHKKDGSSGFQVATHAPSGSHVRCPFL